MPPTQVPTVEEFAALEQRVAALETATPEPPDPEPPDPGPGPDPGLEGKQARRVSHLVELLGYNTFSSMDEGNVWGSWPADYRPQTVIKCFDFMYKGTGFSPRIREYHYEGRQSWQTPWIRQIAEAYPDVQGTVCVGCNGSARDGASVTSMTLEDGDIWRWGEGINEPNMDFGLGGTIGSQQTTDIQTSMHDARCKNLMGPSIVFGLPNAHTYIEAYFDPGHLEQVNASLQHGNGHYYPPHNPDTVGDGASLTDVVGSLWTVYDYHTTMLTEYHSTLYNMARSTQEMAAGSIIKRIIARLAGRLDDGIDEPIPSVHAMEDIDDYYLLLAWFRSALCGVEGLWWYALLDYADVYECGMFPKNEQNPRSPAYAVKRVASICAEDPAKKYTFEPTKLPVEISGLDHLSAYDLYQCSDGRFIIPLWRAAEQEGGVPLEVQFSFGVEVQVEDYDALNDTPAQVARGTSYICRLPFGCRLLVVRVQPQAREVWR